VKIVFDKLKFIFKGIFYVLFWGLVVVVIVNLTHQFIPLDNYITEKILLNAIATENSHIINLSTTFGLSDIVTIVGGIITIYFVIQKLTQHDKHFKQDSNFKNFLEATKMLTDKDSTIEAKISALHLLYDVAKSHPENLDRIIQVINKQIVPLINCLEDNCNQEKYSRNKVSQINYSFVRYRYTREEKFDYIKKDIVSIDLDNRNKRTIKEWQYKGNDTEKLISVSLEILKKIVLNVLPKIDSHIDLSNTILFDLDTDFDKDLKFKTKDKPIENLIFLECNLKNIDYREKIYHRASFINCNLQNSDFSEANLWGTLFQKCDLQDVKFNNTECEAVEFKKCKDLTEEQIENMKFAFKNEEEYKNKSDQKEFLIISSDDINGIDKSKYFQTIDQFNKWKYKDD
jgi:hypothetical protein